MSFSLNHVPLLSVATDRKKPTRSLLRVKKPARVVSDADKAFFSAPVQDLALLFEAVDSIQRSTDRSDLYSASDLLARRDVSNVTDPRGPVLFLGNDDCWEGVYHDDDDYHDVANTPSSFNPEDGSVRLYGEDIDSDRPAHFGIAFRVSETHFATNAHVFDEFEAFAYVTAGTTVPINNMAPPTVYSVSTDYAEFYVDPVYSNAANIKILKWHPDPFSAIRTAQSGNDPEFYGSSTHLFIAPYLPPPVPGDSGAPVFVDGKVVGLVSGYAMFPPPIIVAVCTQGPPRCVLDLVRTRSLVSKFADFSQCVKKRQPRLDRGDYDAFKARQNARFGQELTSAQLAAIINLDHDERADFFEFQALAAYHDDLEVDDQEYYFSREFEGDHSVNYEEDRLSDSDEKEVFESLHGEGSYASSKAKKRAAQRSRTRAGAASAYGRVKFTAKGKRKTDLPPAPVQRVVVFDDDETDPKLVSEVKDEMTVVAGPPFMLPEMITTLEEPQQIPHQGVFLKTAKDVLSVLPSPSRVVTIDDSDEDDSPPPRVAVSVDAHIASLSAARPNVAAVAPPETHKQKAARIDREEIADLTAKINAIESTGVMLRDVVTLDALELVQYGSKSATALLRKKLNKLQQLVNVTKSYAARRRAEEEKARRAQAAVSALTDEIASLSAQVDTLALKTERDF